MLTIIPNQPIVLNPEDRDICLPKDDRVYCPMYQYGDYIKFQSINAGFVSANCNPSFNLSGTNTIINSTFATDLSSWTASSDWTWNSGGGAKLTHVPLQSAQTLVQGGLNISSASNRYIVKVVISGIDVVDSLFINLTADLDGSTSNPLLIDHDDTYYIAVTPSTTPATLTLTFTKTNPLGMDAIVSEISLMDAATCVFGADVDWQITTGGATHLTGNTEQIYLLSPSVGGGTNNYTVYVNADNIGEGSLDVYFDTTLLGTITDDGEYIYETTGASSLLVSLIPSNDFDGRVTYFDCVGYSSDNTVELTDLNGNTYLDLVANLSVSYTKDRINVSVLAGDGADEVQEGCYLLKITTNYPSPQTYISNCINVQETVDCGKLIQGYGDDDTFTLGFLWGVFKLTHRVQFLKFNPEYPIDADDYEYSDGTRNITYAKREKYYTGRTNILDESAHDTISTQILCPYFFVDGIRYFVKPQNYKPLWEKDGKYNVAMANIELRKHSGTIYTK